MIFVRFVHEGRARLGLLDGDEVIDLARAGGIEKGVPDDDLLAVIRDADTVLPVLRKIVGAVMEMTGKEREAFVLRWQEVRPLAPIPRPAKNIFCVGRNYTEHVEEGYRARGMAVNLPKHPQFFTKPSTAVADPDEPFPWDPKITQRLDYEVELGVIIGQTGRDIGRAEALDHVFGYTVINDITARDLQRRHDQWFKGKALDRSCPMGPVVVHRGAIGNPQDLDIGMRVNGELRQWSNTRKMLFDLATIIETLSLGMTLEAGDIIATGTPSGVGYAMDPPQFLNGGDVMEAEIKGIGVLRTPVKEVSDG